MKIEILTTAHWPGDPRLNRHGEYLGAAGHIVSLESSSDLPRWRAVVKTLQRIFVSKADVVILPDPEMFALGSLAARLSGKRPVIDVHEDYPKTAAGRAWVPAWARPVVALLAKMVMSAGRILSWRCLVAAPELAHTGDFVILNIPAPEFAGSSPPSTRTTAVYVGDVTMERGAEMMADIAESLDDRFHLLVVGRLSADAERVLSSAEGEKIEVTGRLDHSQAWDKALGSIAGLCLLKSLPAYRDAVATKIWEYMAAGIPPVVSNLPGQAALVSQIHPDLVCEAIEDCVAVIRRLAEDDDFRDEAIAKGHLLHLQAWEASRPDQTIQSALAP